MANSRASRTMAMSGPASNSTRWQRFTAKHSAWPVLQLPEYREPHYSTTTEEPNDSTSTAIFTYWFLGDDIRDLRIQAPNVDKSQSLEHAEMVKDIIDKTCYQYPHLLKSRLLLVTGGPFHRLDLVELEDKSWDIDTRGLRPGTEAILAYVSKGKYQGSSGPAYHVEYPILELRQVGFSRAVEGIALSNVRQSLMGGFQERIAVPQQHSLDSYFSAILRYQTGRSGNQATPSSSDPSMSGPPVPTTDQNSEAGTSISEAATRSGSQARQAAQVSRPSMTDSADRNIIWRIWHWGSDLRSNLPESCDPVISTKGPSAVVTDILAYHSMNVDLITPSFGSKQIEENEIFIATAAFDSTGHLTRHDANTSPRPLSTTCVVGHFDRDGTPKFLRQGNLKGFNLYNECLSLQRMRVYLKERWENTKEEQKREEMDGQQRQAMENSSMEEQSMKEQRSQDQVVETSETTIGADQGDASAGNVDEQAPHSSADSRA